MFLKHIGDLLFQITIGCDTFEPSAATKNAAVRRYLDLLTPLQLFQFLNKTFFR